MPFYVHRKSLDMNGDTPLKHQDILGARATRGDAQKLCEPDCRITYLPTYEESLNWWTRESSRFNTGEYLQVPWQRETFSHPTACRHYAHGSLHVPGLIAYTPSDEYGVQDRQVRTKPGRYLEKFYADYDKATRLEWIAGVMAFGGTLSIATTPDDCERVYRGKDYVRGHLPFQSCMGPDCHARFTVHPSRVYGEPGDLAVAYLGPIDAVLARAVVWPAKKRYSRIYGSDILRALLKEAGYSTADDFDEAKVIARELDGGPNYLMPYIDGCERARLDRTGKFFILGSGEYSTCRTDGCTGETYTCDHCGENFEGNDDSTTYCPSCEEDRHYCDMCDTDFWGESYYWVNSRGREQYICEGCADDQAIDCVGCEESFNPVYECSNRQILSRSQRHMTEYCHGCDQAIEGGRLIKCEDCDTFYAPTDEDHHDKATRCADCSVEEVVVEAEGAVEPANEPSAAQEVCSE